MPDLKPLERQIRILQQFTLKQSITVNFLYDYFDRQVSRRTLQRDLLALAAANVPLKEERGAHGQIHWSLDPNYLKFIPMTLGMDEFISSLLLQRMGDIFAATPIAKDIKKLDDKLRQLVTDDILRSVGDLQELEPYFSRLNVGYIDYSDYGEQLQKYLFATINRRQFQVTYQSAYRSKPKRFTVQPYSLVLYRGTFYGIVYHPKHKNFLHLLIHRIQQLDIKEQTFTRDPDFNLEEYMSGALGIWHATPEPVAIKFLPEVAPRVAERIWQQDQTITRLEDGAIILQLKIAVSYELVAWILRWGRFAEALNPPRLVEMVREEVKNLQKTYLPK